MKVWTAFCLIGLAAAGSLVPGLIPISGPASAAETYPADLSPAQVMAAMRARATATPHVALTTHRLDKWPVAERKLVSWNDPALFVTGDLKPVKGSPFAEGRSVTYGLDNRSANATTVRTCTDAPWVEAVQKGTGFNSRLTAFVDGARVNGAPVELPSDGRFYATRIAFGAPGKHCVSLLFNNPQFAGILLPEGAKAWAPERKNAFRVMFLGDSYTEFSNHWAVAAARFLGWDDAWLSGVGGTGYINAPGKKFNFGTRFEVDVVAYHPNVLVIAGGINDSGFPPAQLGNAASKLFDRIQKELPDTVVFVLGPWNPRSAISPAINAVLKAAASGRPNFHWVPNYDDHWITGTGRKGAAKGDGNSDFVIGGDGTHPTPEGNRYLAERFAAYVRKTLKLPH